MITLPVGLDFNTLSSELFGYVTPLLAVAAIIGVGFLILNLLKSEG
jgi:hypothetical protein